jgi:hypothetical protein
MNGQKKMTTKVQKTAENKRERIVSITSKIQIQNGL